MWLTPQNRRRLARARERLAEIPDANVPIEQIAREVGLSPFHFIRRFEAAFGVTPHQFRIRHRIDRAKDLLRSGHCSVTEACMAVGFTSVGTFSTLFSRRVGETPSAYRRRMRTVASVPALQPLVAPGCLMLLAYLPPSAFRSFREASDSGLADDGVCASR